MTSRQLASLPVDELERLFDEKRESPDFLQTLLGELSHRKTARARSLKRRVMGAFSVAAPNVAERPRRFLMTPEQHRLAADDYEKGEPDWTDEMREEGRKLAQHHEALARLIEREIEKGGA